MGLHRGAFEVQEPADPITHVFVTKKGEVAFKIVISRAVVGRYGWILKLLQRRVLDAIDPPLRLVADSPPDRERPGPQVSLGPGGYPWQQ